MESLNEVGSVIQDKVKYVEKNVKYVLDNPYIMAILKIALILYASQIAPTLPSNAQATLHSTFFKIIAITLVAYIAEVDFQLAIILSIIFVLSINYLSGRGFFESYSNLEDYGPYYADQTKYQTLLGKSATVGTATLLDGNSDNYSGCDNIKMADLLAVFDNDALKMQKTIQYAFNSLVQQLPKDSDAMTNLITIAKAIGLPGNVKFSDSTAPLVASILIQYGFKINNTCQAPYGDGMINV